MPIDVTCYWNACGGKVAQANMVCTPSGVSFMPPPLEIDSDVGSMFFSNFLSIYFHTVAEIFKSTSVVVVFPVFCPFMCLYIYMHVYACPDGYIL